jgi:hypothetical protein
MWPFTYLPLEIDMKETNDSKIAEQLEPGTTVHDELIKAFYLGEEMRKALKALEDTQPYTKYDEYKKNFEDVKQFLYRMHAPALLVEDDGFLIGKEYPDPTNPDHIVQKYIHINMKEETEKDVKAERNAAKAAKIKEREAHTTRVTFEKGKFMVIGKDGNPIDGAMVTLRKELNDINQKLQEEANTNKKIDPSLPRFVRPDHQKLVQRQQEIQAKLAPSAPQRT